MYEEMERVYRDSKEKRKSDIQARTDAYFKLATGVIDTIVLSSGQSIADREKRGLVVVFTPQLSKILQEKYTGGRYLPPKAPSEVDYSTDY